MILIFYDVFISSTFYFNVIIGECDIRLVVVVKVCWCCIILIILNTVDLYDEFTIKLLY